MSSNLTQLGLVPQTLRVHLTTGADFYCTRTLRTGGVASDWPANTVLTLTFDTGEAWTATIAGAVATFNVDKAVADTIADDTGVRFRYVNGSTDQTWEVGTVVRHG